MQDNAVWAMLSGPTTVWTNDGKKESHRDWGLQTQHISYLILQIMPYSYISLQGNKFKFVEFLRCVPRDVLQRLTAIMVMAAWQNKASRCERSHTRTSVTWMPCSLHTDSTNTGGRVLPSIGMLQLKLLAGLRSNSIWKTITFYLFNMGPKMKSFFIIVVQND